MTVTTIDPDHRVALIRINKLYRLGMDGASLYQATRKWWVVDPERGAEWAFALYHGKVKGVFALSTGSLIRSERGAGASMVNGTRRWSECISARTSPITFTKGARDPGPVRELLNPVCSPAGSRL